MATSWLDAAASGGGALLHYLAMNPTIIAAVIAASVAVIVARTTLHGVKMSLASSEAKTTRELAHSVDQENRNREHTRHEAARERELDAKKDRHARLIELRRGVYLDAVTEVIKFHGVIGDLPKFDFSKGDSKELINGLAIAIYRVSIVAEQSTAVCAKKTHGTYMKLFLRCLVKVAPIAQMRTRLDELDQLVANVTTRADGYIESMRQFNLAQRKDQGAFDAIRVQLEINERERVRLATEQAELSQQRQAAQSAFSDYVLSELREKISAQLDILTVAMRTELELSSDLAAFQTLTAETNKEIVEILAEIKAALAGGPMDSPS